MNKQRVDDQQLRRRSQEDSRQADQTVRNGRFVRHFWAVTWQALCAVTRRIWQQLTTPKGR